MYENQAKELNRITVRLNKIIEAIGFKRDEVFIANVLKCRPPGNRDPKPEETAACKPYLLEQIRLIEPKVICTLGRIAAQALLETTRGKMQLRGQVQDFMGIKLVPTFHPAALLRNPKWKRPTWEDVQLVRGLPRGLPDVYFFRHAADGSRPGPRFGKRFLYGQWKNACGQLGIEGVDLYGGTRHSSAVAMRGSATPEQIRQATMHSTSKAFERYYRTSPDELRRLYSIAAG